MIWKKKLYYGKFYINTKHKQFYKLNSEPLKDNPNQGTMSLDNSNTFTLHKDYKLLLIGKSQLTDG